MQHIILFLLLIGGTVVQFEQTSLPHSDTCNLGTYTYRSNKSEKDCVFFFLFRIKNKSLKHFLYMIMVKQCKETWGNYGTQNLQGRRSFLNISNLNNFKYLITSSYTYFCNDMP